MNQYLTASVIKELREKNNLTQMELAQKLNVSDKTISKWETGRGLPDITLIDEIAKVFNISLIELLSGNAVSNTNISANMKRSKFYVCPICSNVIYSVGEAVCVCHGITLPPLEAEKCDEMHDILIETVEDEYFVTVKHDMSREHYISFIATVSGDRVQLVKLYPEGNAETRFKINCVSRLYFYCNKDGLYYKDIKKQQAM